MAKRKKKYLNNRDMLAEIHKSKISYCMFKDPITDSQQDYIVESTEDIFGTHEVAIGKDEDGEPVMGHVPVIDLATAARASRLTKLGIPTDIDEVEVEDIVFRVMTTEHIPLVPKKKAKKKKPKKKSIVVDLFEELEETPEETPDVTDDTIVPDSQDHTIAVLKGEELVEMVPMRAKFPPFFHYRMGTNGLELIGKSHWRGESLDDGEFCMEHGKTTDTLAMMYIKLCERYARRSNWHGYTYIDEMRGQALLQLSQIGLQFNEMKSQNPFAYYTAAVTNSFTRILNIEKKMQNIRDDILEQNGLTPSWTRQFKNDNSDQKYIDNPDD